MDHQRCCTDSVRYAPLNRSSRSYACTPGRRFISFCPRSLPMFSLSLARTSTESDSETERAPALTTAFEEPLLDSLHRILETAGAPTNSSPAKRSPTIAQSSRSMKEREAEREQERETLALAPDQARHQGSSSCSSHTRSILRFSSPMMPPTLLKSNTLSYRSAHSHLSATCSPFLCRKTHEWPKDQKTRPAKAQVQNVQERIQLNPDVAILYGPTQDNDGTTGYGDSL